MLDQESLDQVVELDRRVRAARKDGGGEDGVADVAADEVDGRDELGSRRGAELTCTLDRAMLAGPRGITVVPWKRKTLSRRAALALRLAYDRPFLQITDDQLLVSLINAAARLASANEDSDRS